MQLHEAVALCMRHRWKGTAGESTAEINATAALEYFGRTSKLTLLTYASLQGYVQHLAQKGNAPDTINRKLSTLSAVLTEAVRRGELASRPIMPYQRKPQGRTRYLTPAEESQVLSFFLASGMIDHAQVLEVLIDTGMRPSELWELTPAEIQGSAVLIRESKNGRPRLIPLTQRAAFIIQRRIVRYGHNILFPHDNRWLEYGWNKAKRALGLKDDKEFIPYALRHTCASRLLQRGTPLDIVSRWLGHSNLQMTMRYAHISLDQLQKAARTLE